jgi:hypothetical protein
MSRCWLFRVRVPGSQEEWVSVVRVGEVLLRTGAIVESNREV